MKPPSDLFDAIVVLTLTLITIALLFTVARAMFEVAPSAAYAGVLMSI